jgi:hypothetical protein
MTRAVDDDAGAAGIEERRPRLRPSTMTPAQPGSRSGAHDTQAVDDDAGNAGVEERRP